MLALTIQFALVSIFALLVSLFFAAQFTKIIRRMSPTGRIFLPGAIFAALQIVAAIFF